jgi:hypothetical protein
MCNLSTGDWELRRHILLPRQRASDEREVQDLQCVCGGGDWHSLCYEDRVQKGSAIVEVSKLQCTHPFAWARLLIREPLMNHSTGAQR